jgi:hypothetical protein
MKFRDVPQSGSRGGTTASHNRFGPFQRGRVIPVQPRTAAQHGVWENMADLSWLWNQLTEEQWAAWRLLAPHVLSRSKMGKRFPLDACQVFKKLNRVLATCGRPPLFDPPPLPQFGRNPVEGFEIRILNSRLAFMLKLSPKISWEARSPLEDLMLYGWVPCNPSVERSRNWAFLGLLPPPVRGEIDITDLYLAKLKQWRKLRDGKYHLPLPGSRIFVRVWQQINGWENELGRLITSSRVPVGKFSVPGERSIG